MRKIWNLTSSLYKRLRLRFPFRVILEAENQNLRKLIRLLALKPVIGLDLGAGHGNALNQYYFELARNNSSMPQILAIDFSVNMLKNIKKDHLIDPIQADVLHVPVKSHCVDFVLLIGVTEYIRDLPALLAEINRILRPRGEAIISISPRNWIFYARFFLGKKLFGISEMAFVRLLEQTDFQIKQKHSSFMQIQFLLARNS